MQPTCFKPSSSTPLKCLPFTRKHFPNGCSHSENTFLKNSLGMVFRHWKNGLLTVSTYQNGNRSGSSWWRLLTKSCLAQDQSCVADVARFQYDSPPDMKELGQTCMQVYCHVTDSAYHSKVIGCNLVLNNGRKNWTTVKWCSNTPVLWDRNLGHHTVTVEKNKAYIMCLVVRVLPAVWGHSSVSATHTLFLPFGW